MDNLATTKIASMTDLREPQKVLDHAAGQPVAILKNSALVAYLVPAEAVTNSQHRHATLEEVLEVLDRTRAAAQPVLDYLKDK